ncbi:MAG: two-component system response regulator [Alphaproteobacteria bacterium CG11_big_fil_rev_8_21_14_0_20_39_49]|nr:MAG: two-component system response regulator [Alphaproteobacteria bacterium CG11_big_fil_rev_8_21_14_0_20_39_49]
MICADIEVSMPLFMVLDDNEIAREVASKVLSQLHVHPVEMADSEAALEYCKEKTPDLIILDIMMPKMDGIEFLREFRNIQGNKRTYVIACSARNDEATVHKMTKLGINDYILKPFSPEMLETKLIKSGLLD